MKITLIAINNLSKATITELIQQHLRYLITGNHPKLHQQASNYFDFIFFHI